MQYFRNTNQIQTVGLNKPIGGREECRYTFVTNAYAVGPNAANPLQICNNTQQDVFFPYYNCDTIVENNTTITTSPLPGGPWQSLGCVSTSRYGPAVPAGAANRPTQVLVSPFTCETQFTQSMTEYEYVTFTSLGFGDPYITGSTPPVLVNNNVYSFALASYIPSGSTQYEYKVIQLLPNCAYPTPTVYYEPGTPLWGPIAIVSGSAYYSVGAAYPKGDEPVNPTMQSVYFSPYP